MRLLSDALMGHGLCGIVLSPPGTEISKNCDGVLAVVPQTISVDELWGRLAAIHQYRPLFRHIEKQVAVMQRLGKKLNQQFTQVDQELRLASRLQRDFLPKSFPKLGDIHFDSLFRPASHVSGDIYEVVRLDESHIGFYLADAVGHGIAAGLLTMFIKQAMPGKHIDEHGHTILTPRQVLHSLNRTLVQQDLPNCQFVTALYGLINIKTNDVSLARGGHPHPIHVNAFGRCAQVLTSGGLLGIFPDEDFSVTTLRMEPGDKLILYSDGVENEIVSQRDSDRSEVEFTPFFRDAIRQPLSTFMTTMAARLDGAEGSLEPMDDVTILGIERRIAEPPS